jgi:hypothetical protein
MASLLRSNLQNLEYKKIKESKQQEEKRNPEKAAYSLF